MQSVSTAYKTQIEKNLRNISYIKVNLGVVNPDAPNNDNVSDNGSLFISDTTDVDMGKAVIKRYVTMEHNKCILDGNSLYPPEVGQQTPYFQGFIGNEISSSVDGTFSVNPKVTIDFTTPFKFIGLTFRFDSVLLTYPTEFQIIGYYLGSEVFNQTIYPTTYDYQLDTPIPASGYVDKLEFVFKKTYPFGRRAVMEYVLFGLVKTFTDEVVTESNWKRTVDLVTAKLPTASFDFTFIDVNKDYNPDNAQGFWQYIEKRQPVSWEYGYELDDGSIEWVSGGSLYTDGDIKINSSGALSNVTFSASALLNQLEDTYYKGTYNSTPKTYYDIAVDILSSAGLPILMDGSDPYFVSTDLQSMSTSVPVPEMSIKEAIQLVANACRCVLYVNRSGQIRVERASETLQDFAFTLANMKSTPSVSKVPSLLTVSTSYSTLTPSSTAEQLASASVSGASNTVYRFTYEMATNVNLSVSGLTIVGSPTYYATSCIVTLTGTGTVTITGKKLVKSTKSVVYTAGTVGYDCPIENELIDNATDALAYAQWVGSILSRRNEYSVDHRGYPELDILDCINVDTLFSTGLEATITKSELKYNGALSGNATFLSKEVS